MIMALTKWSSDLMMKKKHSYITRESSFSLGTLPGENSTYLEKIQRTWRKFNVPGRLEKKNYEKTLENQREIIEKHA